MAETTTKTSTPSATAAAAQSRTGHVAETESGIESGEVLEEVLESGAACPGLGRDFEIGDGVERAARVQPYERKSDDPLYRPLRIFTADPATSQFDIAVTTVNVPYEPLQPGPVGALFEVDAYDYEQEISYNRVNLDDPRVLIQGGLAPTPSSVEFHQQMAYAVCSTVYAAFEKALGRSIAWGFEETVASEGTNETTSEAADGREAPLRLRIRPFAFHGKNAYYDKTQGTLSFGYFQTGPEVRGRNPPAGFVFTGLSHDIVAHEVTHALLDGLRAHFFHPSGPDVLAFHEAFADLIAVFQRFNYEPVIDAAIGHARGQLSRAAMLTGIARQFGETTGLNGALRYAVDELDEKGDAPVDANGNVRRVYDAKLESHELGSVLVAAVFEAFLTVYRRKTAPLLRLATGGTSILPPGDISADLRKLLVEQASSLAGQFLSICIRAIDYCPPVDLNFGDYLRALITADYDLVPDDPHGYREALIDAFWRRRIYPESVRSLTQDALLWRSATRRIESAAELSLSRLHFRGHPGRPAGADELRRQACALGALITQEVCREECGLEKPGEVDGDIVEKPKIQSIRTARRAGPDGQIAFDLVAEVTQKRLVRNGGPSYEMYGGATIILGPDGDIRYIISKSHRRAERRECQRDFIAGAGREMWEESQGRLKPRPDWLRRLHQQALQE